MADITPTQELDLSGIEGKLPERRIGEAVRMLNAGDVLKVVATGPRSVADMAAFSRSTGHEIIDQSEGGGEYTFHVRRA
jgi:tRNA 2-thiouridine synthesizing protein A